MGTAYSAKRMKIAPETALKWLDKTEKTIQRPVSQRHVNKIANSIRRGQWRCNGETIILDRQNQILDGQHRLWACVESGTEIESYVIVGMDQSVFATIDTGRHRTNGDALHIDRHGDEPVSRISMRVIAKAAKLLLCTSSWNVSVTKQSDITNEDVVEYVRGNPSIISSCEYLRSLGKSPVKANQLLWLYHQVKDNWPECNVGFFEPLITGTEIPRESPMKILRDKACMIPRPIDYKKENIQLYYLAKTWNAWVSSSPMRILRYRPELDVPPSLIINRGSKSGSRPSSRPRGKKKATRKPDKRLNGGL